MIRLLEHINKSVETQLILEYGYRNFDIPLLVADNDYFLENNTFKERFQMEAEDDDLSYTEQSEMQGYYFDRYLQDYVDAERNYRVTRDLARKALSQPRFIDYSDILDCLDSDVADDGWIVVYRWDEDHLERWLENHDQISKENLEQVCRDYLQALVAENRKKMIGWLPLVII